MVTRFDKIVLLSLSCLGLWKIIPWETLEKNRQWDVEWQADRAAYEEYIHYVNEVRQTFARQMFNELQLVCEGHRGKLHGKAEELGMQFRAYRRASVDEARALLLHVMHKFAEAINAHEKLRPFLEEYPFTHKRIKIAISFEGPNGRCADGSIAYVFNISTLTGVKEHENRLFYHSIDPFAGELVDLLGEPYGEAVRLSLANPIENLAVHQGAPIEDAIDDVLSRIVEQMEKDYGFECWSVGGKVTDVVEEIGARFVLTKRKTQEEARVLLLSATEKVLQTLNHHEKIKPFLIEAPFPTDRIKIRLRFTNQRYCPYGDDSMESVFLENNQITYRKKYPLGTELYYADEPFAIETYREATHIAQIQ